jgi:hypothetical protein
VFLKSKGDAVRHLIDAAVIALGAAIMIATMAGVAMWERPVDKARQAPVISRP